MLRFIKSGFYTSIQDRGRFGYRHFGVPVSGAMDQYAAKIANDLLGNDRNAAVLEFTMTGPELEFDANTYIAMSGAQLEATLEGESLRMNTVHQVKKGDVIKFGRMSNGFRTYMAIKGGFRTEEVLGSRSFYQGITPNHYLQDLQQIPYEACDDYEPLITDLSPERKASKGQLIVSQGPEYDMLENRQLEKIFSQPFTVAMENNRMAYQLDEHIPGHERSMITSVTLPGTVQFTPAGKLIILMRDGQTTGGYPRILQLNDHSINTLAQKKYGDTVQFRLG